MKGLTNRCTLSRLEFLKRATLVCTALCLTPHLACARAELNQAAAAENERLAGMYAYIGKSKTCGVPQIGIFGDVTTALANGTVYYKRNGRSWAKSPLEFNGAHALTRLPDGRWIIADTGNNRLVQVDDLSGTAGMIVLSDLAGYVLTRPHYVTVDPQTGDIYVIDFNRRLFRVHQELGAVAEAWTFTPEEMGYVRSLSWFDGHLHVIHATRGEVFRIDDYERHRYTRFRSPRPVHPRGLSMSWHNDFPAGALSTTGLVLNAVEKSGEWYYGTNDFLIDFASGADTGPARLIRWHSWKDFERGKWEDLSAYIPRADIPLVPYFITIHNNVLYTPVDGKPDERCEHSQVLQLNLGLLPKK